MLEKALEKQFYTVILSDLTIHILCFRPLRLFHRQLTAKICVFCLVPAPPWAIRSNPPCVSHLSSKYLAWPSPSACLNPPSSRLLDYWWSSVVPQFPVFTFSGRLAPVQADSCPSTASVSQTVDALLGCHLDLRCTPPLFPPTMPLVLPMVLLHPTAGKLPGFPPSQHILAPIDD